MAEKLCNHCHKEEKMINKEEFLVYETIRKTGITNMFDIFAVVKCAKKYYNVKLSKPKIIEIMHNYTDLVKKFG